MGTVASYFELRYAVPGYSFILVLLAMIAPTLMVILKNNALADTGLSLLGVALGFATLLGGSAIGYIVSQPWYFLFERCLGGALGTNGIGTPFVLLNNNFANRTLSELSAIRDFLLNKYANPMVMTYLERRWQLVNTLGSTAVSMVLGMIIGLTIVWPISGLIAIAAFFSMLFGASASSVLILMVSNCVFLYWGALCVGIIILVIIMWENCIRALNDSRRTTVIALRDIESEQWVRAVPSAPPNGSVNKTLPELFPKKVFE